MATVPFEVITPEGPAGIGEVDFVVLPGAEGELGVLPGHMALVARCRAGTVRYYQGGAEHRMRTADGYAHVEPGRVRLLTAHADPG